LLKITAIANINIAGSVIAYFFHNSLPNKTEQLRAEAEFHYKDEGKMPHTVLSLDGEKE